MGFKLVFHFAVAFSIFTGGNSTPSGCGCPCRPPAPPPQPCAPVVPIMLDNCGPNPCPLPPINAPPVQAPVVNKGPVSLPACVPPPKTIANTCHCVKTVVKPQVVQQLITVPSIQRYIQTTHTPVVENIVYHGVPINCPPYAPEPPAPAAPAPAPAPPCAAPTLPLALSLAKPPTATIPAGLLAMLSLAARAPPALPPCPPPAPALSPCLPCLPVAPPPLPPPSSTVPASVSLPPCLLSLLSKLL